MSGVKLRSEVMSILLCAVEWAIGRLVIGLALSWLGYSHGTFANVLTTLWLIYVPAKWATKSLRKEAENSPDNQAAHISSNTSTSDDSARASPFRELAIRGIMQREGVGREDAIAHLDATMPAGIAAWRDKMIKDRMKTTGETWDVAAAFIDAKTPKR